MSKVSSALFARSPPFATRSPAPFATSTVPFAISIVAPGFIAAVPATVALTGFLAETLAISFIPCHAFFAKDKFLRVVIPHITAGTHSFT